jgi:hypothetical protein
MLPALPLALALALPLQLARDKLWAGLAWLTGMVVIDTG